MTVTYRDRHDKNTIRDGHLCITDFVHRFGNQ